MLTLVGDPFRIGGPVQAGGTWTEVFAQRVAQSGGTPAVVDGPTCVTYAELAAEVDAFASELDARGVGAGDVLAVSGPVTLATIRVLLAAWRRGAIFLPLDSRHPEARLGRFRERAAPKAEFDTTRGEWVYAKSGAAATQSVAPGIDAAAYLIFTSGSTGEPKGVEVPHRGLANLATAQAETFGLSVGTRVLQFASPGFDAFIAEVVATLGAGATLHIPSPDLRRSTERLWRYMERAGIEVVTMPPSLLAVTEPIPAIKTIVSAGEACPVGVVDRWASESRRFVNAYGPTEATVCSTMVVVERGASFIPLGDPLPGVKVAVSPENGDGSEGELLIGGIGVATGYWQAPELTADRFFSDENERWYRSGDRVRVRDGELEFVSRIDNSVKVSGFLVNLGEVERTLEGSSGVTRAVVECTGQLDTRILVAFLVGDDIDLDAVKEDAKKVLPHYMIPSRWKVLQALPMTVNGKVDRYQLLQDLDSDAVASGDDLPARIWQSVTGSWPKDDDQFFQVGGTSLGLLRLLRDVSSHSGVGISPAVFLLGEPTFGRLRTLLSVGGSDGGADNEWGWLVCRKEASGPPIFLFPPVTGDPLAMVQLVANLPASSPCVIASPRGWRSGEPATSIHEMAAFVLENCEEATGLQPAALIGYSVGGLVAYECARQMQQQGKSPSLILIDAPSPKGEGAKVDMPEFVAAKTMVKMLATTLGLEPPEGPSPQEDPVAWLRPVLANLGLSEGEMPEEQARRRLRLFHSTLLGAIAYPASEYEAPAMVLNSSEGHPFNPDPALFDWSKVLTGDPDVQTISASHFTFLARHSSCEAAAKLIEKHVDQSQSK